MNKANIPGFTADASLYRTSNRYRPLAGEPQRTVVIPQLPPLGGLEFKGLQGCITDCVDKHPELTPDQCSRRCHDPFAGADLSTPRNSFNDFLSGGGIDFWEAGCTALVNPYLCRKVADVMRRQS
jgi:hypothetical protein